jgi:23S rRNA pseudouridine1911/1915/1917 synthase
MNELFKTGKVKKTYWAIVGKRPEKESDTLNSLPEEKHAQKINHSHTGIRSGDQNKLY